MKMPLKLSKSHESVVPLSGNRHKGEKLIFAGGEPTQPACQFASGITQSQNRKFFTSQPQLLECLSTCDNAHDMAQSERETEFGSTALRGHSILQCNRPAVRFGDLTAQRQANA